MPDAAYPMQRYTFDVKKNWVQRVIECAGQYRQKHGVTPTIAHISELCKDAPPNVGVVRLVPAWGLFPFEMDLAVEPKTEGPR